MDGQEGDQSPPEATRFHFTLWKPTGNLELSAQNSVLCTNPCDADSYFLWFSSSEHRLGLPHTSAFIYVALRSATMLHDVLCTSTALLFKNGLLIA